VLLRHIHEFHICTLDTTSCVLDHFNCFLSIHSASHRPYTNIAEINNPESCKSDAIVASPHTCHAPCTWPLQSHSPNFIISVHYKVIMSSFSVCLFFIHKNTSKLLLRNIRRCVWIKRTLRWEVYCRYMLWHEKL